MPIQEGKRPLTFNAYRYLANVALKSTDFGDGIFSHIFLLLSWNLTRCISIAGIMLSHVSWTNDSLVIVIPQHKGDQEGKHCAPKHVYANPVDPLICPVLSLAIYIFTEGQRFNGGNHCLFGNPNNEDHNSKHGCWVVNFILFLKHLNSHQKWFM